MSGFRELWLEYIEDLPVECMSREAEAFQQYITGCLSEQVDRIKGTKLSVSDYIRIRRQAGGVWPLVVSYRLHHGPFLFFPTFVRIKGIIAEVLSGFVYCRFSQIG